LNADVQGVTATLLTENGKVLIAGGSTAGTNATAVRTVQLYDQVANTISAAGTIQLGTARWQHTATLLPDGRVLIAGGANTGGPTAKAEIFVPTAAAGAGAFVPTMDSLVTRTSHGASLQPDGNVWIAGGAPGSPTTNSTEVFTP
jgi:hypothetical protein